MKQKKLDIAIWEIFNIMSKPGKSSILGVNDLIELTERHNLGRVNLVFFAIKRTGLVQDAKMVDIDLGEYTSPDHIQLTEEGLYVVAKFKTYKLYRRDIRRKRFCKAVTSNWTINGLIILITFVGGILWQSQGVFVWIKEKMIAHPNTQTEQKSDSLIHNTDTSGIHKSIHHLPSKKTQ